MAIYYNILYPPLVPITHPAFELGKPTDTFRLFFEPAVGNKISDFKGGFIRIRNAETEKSALLPVGEGYLDDFIPFRNPFAEYIDLKDPSKNIIQPTGYNTTIPYVQKNANGEYFIDIKQEAFTMSGAEKDVRYKMQIMLTTDWLSSTKPNGRGNIQTYSSDVQQYVNIDKTTYFGGNLISKGLSEWSTISLISPVSEAIYELQFDGDNIFSPIFEFVGSNIQENIRNNTMANYLKAYRIDIYRANGDEKELFIDSSDWIIGQEPSNIEIRWQNVVELEDKNKYIVELSIQTAWDLRKTFTYHVTTQFEGSLFRGTVSVENDHDNARSKIKLNIKTPLQWGPKENFEISLNDREFADATGEVSVLEGIDFFNKQAAIAGEMIVSGIKPIKTWEAKEDRWFFRLKGPEISTINPYQEEYLMYAHTAPLGKDKASEGPYEDDIIINPVIESPSGDIYLTYLDSSKTPTTEGGIIGGMGGIVTIPSEDLPSSHTFFYLEDENQQLWKTTVTINGEFVTEQSHEKDPTEFLKPVCFFDSYHNILVVPRVETDGTIVLDTVYENYVLGENVRPMYLNEFRFVKRVYALELGRKTLLTTQTYKAYMNDFNKKLNKWVKIQPTRKYYMYFSCIDGQIRLIVRDLSADDSQNSLDRFTLTYSEGFMNSVGISSDMFLTTTGLGSDFLPKVDLSGKEVPYTITADERGVLGTDVGNISAATTRSRDLLTSDIEELKSKGEIE